MKKHGDGLRAWNAARRDRLLPEVPKVPASTPAAIRPLTPRQVARRLVNLRCDPLAILARLANNTHLDPLLRAALARHLAEYQIAQTPDPRGGASGKRVPALGDVIADGWRKKIKPPAKTPAKPPGKTKAKR